MSWRYKKHYSYRRSSYRTNFYYSEKELDFTNENLDYNQFLLQEFFNANIETKNKISKYYIEKFGDRSFAYLRRTYLEWANGNYHLTDLMSGRILSMMPRFLNSEAKHKLGIHQFMSTIKKAVKTFERKQNQRYNRTQYVSRKSELVEIFEKEYSEIQSYSYDNLNIYGHRIDMLKDDELLEAIEISKYILEVKLQNLYDQIERDFQTFLPFIQNLKIGTFESLFKINAFDIEINIAKLDSNEIKVPKFKIPEIETNTDFKKYSDKYLAYEFVGINRKSKEQIARSFLNNNDLQLFLNHYIELSNYDSEVSFDSTFLGESGELKIKARLVPPKILKTSLLYAFMKLSIYIVITISLIALAIRNEANTLLLIGGFFVGIFAFTMISEEIKKIRTLTKELKTYG
jgi:hypothetical protein